MNFRETAEFRAKALTELLSAYGIEQVVPSGLTSFGFIHKGLPFRMTEQEIVTLFPIRPKTGCIQTFSGRIIDVLKPDANVFDPIDMAHSLGAQPRFLGHTKRFYSVAEHTVRMARHFRSSWALMHDAIEYILYDLPKPIKMLFPEYGELENAWLEQLATRYGLEWPMPEIVKQWDLQMLATEKEQLMARGYNWNLNVEPLDITLMGWLPTDAKAAWLLEFRKYFGDAE